MRRAVPSRSPTARTVRGSISPCAERTATPGNPGRRGDGGAVRKVDGPSTDWVVRLCDVDDDQGVSRNIVDGDHPHAHRTLAWPPAWRCGGGPVCACPSPSQNWAARLIWSCQCWVSIRDRGVQEPIYMPRPPGCAPLPAISICLQDRERSSPGFTNGGWAWLVSGDQVPYSSSTRSNPDRAHSISVVARSIMPW